MVKIGDRFDYIDRQSPDMTEMTETTIETGIRRSLKLVLIFTGGPGTCHLGFGQFHGEGAAGNDSKSNWCIRFGACDGEPGVRGSEEFDHWCEEARGGHGPQWWRGLPEHDVRMVE
jgi:hypothetical protein